MKNFPACKELIPWESGPYAYAEEIKSGQVNIFYSIRYIIDVGKMSLNYSKTCLK